MPELNILTAVDPVDCPPIDMTYKYQRKTYAFRICNPCAAASHWKIEGDEMSEKVMSRAIEDAMLELRSVYERMTKRFMRRYRYGDYGDDD